MGGQRHDLYIAKLQPLTTGLTGVPVTPGGGKIEGKPICGSGGGGQGTTGGGR